MARVSVASGTSSHRNSVDLFAKRNVRSGDATADRIGREHADSIDRSVTTARPHLERFRQIKKEGFGAPPQCTIAASSYYFKRLWTMPTTRYRMKNRKESPMRSTFSRQTRRVINVANNLTGRWGFYREYHEAVHWGDHEVAKQYCIYPADYWIKYGNHNFSQPPANDN